MRFGFIIDATFRKPDFLPFPRMKRKFYDKPGQIRGDRYVRWPWHIPQVSFFVTLMAYVSLNYIMLYITHSTLHGF